MCSYAFCLDLDLDVDLSPGWRESSLWDIGPMQSVRIHVRCGHGARFDSGRREDISCGFVVCSV
jgi:hypothetical protein